MCKIREKQTVDFVTVSAAAFAGVVLSTSLAGKRGNFGLMLLAFTKEKGRNFLGGKRMMQRGRRSNKDEEKRGNAATQSDAGNARERQWVFCLFYSLLICSYLTLSPALLVALDRTARKDGEFSIFAESLWFY